MRDVGTERGARSMRRDVLRAQLESEAVTVTADRQSAFWRLAAHAARHSPWHADQSWAGRLRRGAALDVKDIPLLGKDTVREAPEALTARTFVAGHEARLWVYTSGSTGTPLGVLKSRRQAAIEEQEARRLKQSWHGVLPGPHLIVRCATANEPFGTCQERRAIDGSLVVTVYGLETALIADTIERIGAASVHTWPSMARSLLARDREALASMRAFSTRAEVLLPELRQRLAIERSWRALDVYGANEVGVLAVECADCGYYHTAQRSAQVEVLREDGTPAAPGEIGHVVATPLASYAMPLLRYALGDLALVAEPTTCSAGRLTLERILGRDRHIFLTPEGRPFVPMLHPLRLVGLPLRQFKLVQIEPAVIEFHYVPYPDADVDTAVLRALAIESMPAGFAIRLRKVASIPAAPSGKHFMHERLFGDGL